ncbi:MAG: hypothetical protein KJO98_09670 [Rhodothermia bacterium]|nr:hypothetical protein [Rhodothermia bacterium]
MRSSIPAILILLTLLLSACRTADDTPLDEIATEYVLLSLQLNTHDEGYVDAYYGDPSWRTEAEAAPASIQVIRQRADSLLTALEDLIESTDQPADRQFSRARYLERHLSSMLGRIEILEGKEFSFDEEARTIYDAEPPYFTDAHFDSILAEINTLLPGSGSLADRVTDLQSEFVIPDARLDTVFWAAMDECRARTARHIALPGEEEFTVEYVTDKPWSGYNWYQGNAKSLIQVNTDAEIRIQRAIDLACHEGYPGHHVLSLLREKRYLEDGWVEFSLLPLYAPIATLAEGSANYGIRVAFPGQERVEFEKEVLFPLAGLDASRADLYYDVLELTAGLSYARNEAARKYLSGEWDVDTTVDWLVAYQLTTQERARQSIRFIDAYRAYIINYNYGQDLVREYIESNSESADEAWALFEDLLESPAVPSDLY